MSEPWVCHPASQHLTSSGRTHRFWWPRRYRASKTLRGPDSSPGARRVPRCPGVPELRTSMTRARRLRSTAVGFWRSSWILRSTAVSFFWNKKTWHRPPPDPWDLHCCGRQSAGQRSLGPGQMRGPVAMTRCEWTEIESKMTSYDYLVMI